MRGQLLPSASAICLVLMSAPAFMLHSDCAFGPPAGAVPRRAPQACVTMHGAVSGHGHGSRRQALEVALGASFPVLWTCLPLGAAAAPATGRGPVCRMEASSSEAAFDMVILMRSARALREAGERQDAGDLGPIAAWLTASGFSDTGGEGLGGPNPRRSLERLADASAADSEAAQFFDSIAALKTALRSPHHTNGSDALVRTAKHLDVLLSALGMPSTRDSDPVFLPCNSDWSCDCLYYFRGERKAAATTKERTMQGRHARTRMAHNLTSSNFSSSWC